jgi:hypothetical protein
MSADARRWWLAPIAREEGGRSDEVLFDSTGVLFRLPMADMLSMVMLKLEKLRLSTRIGLNDVSGIKKCETKLQVYSNASSNVNAPTRIRERLPRTTWTDEWPVKLNSCFALLIFQDSSQCLVVLGECSRGVSNK